MGHTTSVKSTSSPDCGTSLMGETPSRKSAAARTKSLGQKASQRKHPKAQDTTTNTSQGQGQDLTGVGSQFSGAGYDDGVYPDELEIESTDASAPTN